MWASRKQILEIILEKYRDELDKVKTDPRKIVELIREVAKREGFECI
jgi:vacuolar-type H+-ATPase subunit E/Vma4